MPGRPADPALFVPLPQLYSPQAHLHVRTIPGFSGNIAAFAASRRAREVAIRMALGATDGDVTRFLVRSGSRAPLLGLGAGVAIGIALSLIAANVVAGVQAADPAALVAVAVVMTVLSAIALTVPVRSLLHGAPMRRLREE
jgi:ABC-type lipoprotein release transport system permease subunit